MKTIFIGLTLLMSYCNGLIVPQQVFSFQHLVDFALPLMRKGTDSRTGFGFRVGNHSDFQVTFEIGPQKFTRPLGKPFSANAGDDISNANKRMADSEAFEKGSTEVKAKNPSKTSTLQYAPIENDLLKVLFGTRNQYALPASSIKATTFSRQLTKSKPNDLINYSAINDRAT